MPSIPPEKRGRELDWGFTWFTGWWRNTEEPSLWRANRGGERCFGFISLCSEKMKKEILTFGPVCILSKYQRRGYGKMLIEHSFQTALKLGYDAVVIFGNPANYVGCGFKSCRKFHVSVEGGLYPAAMMVRELIPGALREKNWTYRDSPAMSISEEEARAYDDTLAPKERKYQPSQEEFYIMSHSFLQD
ncbi:MAG: GNAT family N-acetyltransferase [Clostridium sp.]